MTTEEARRLAASAIHSTFCTCGEMGSNECSIEPSDLADYLTVVQQIVAQARAEALGQAAADWAVEDSDLIDQGLTDQWLRQRADASRIRPAEDQP